MKVFVVTDPERGWNCVKGVYQAKSEDDLKVYLLKEQDHTEEPEFWGDNNVIHEQRLISIK